jgi:hypothetical protein
VCAVEKFGQEVGETEGLGGAGGVAWELGRAVLE